MEAITIEKAFGNVEHILDLLFIGWRPLTVTEKDKIYTGTYYIDTGVSDKKAFYNLVRGIKMKYFSVGKVFLTDNKLVVNIAQTRTIPAWLL